MERRHKLELDAPIVDGIELLTRESFRKQVKKCRELFPVKIPVRVYWVKNPPEGCLGYSLVTYDDDWNPQHASIWISSSLQRAHAIDTLIHEWTHIVYDSELLDRPENHDCSDRDHTGLFWQLYGQHCAVWNKSIRVV